MSTTSTGKFRIIERSYGDLGYRFPTQELAQAFLDADEYYDRQDMGIWIEETA